MAVKLENGRHMGLSVLTTYRSDARYGRQHKFASSLPARHEPSGVAMLGLLQDTLRAGGSDRDWYEGY